MTDTKISERKRRRIHAMLWAYLTFHMRKMPPTERAEVTWRFLLEWASLGGKPEEVIR